MEVTVCDIPLTLLKKNDNWAVYLQNNQTPFYMQLKGEDWCFIGEGTPTDLIEREEKISLYIRMKDE